MLAFLQMEYPRLAITHGDGWYMNAIKGDDCGVYLIDWDNVGMGAPILDLGYLLLSSHFRLESPFVIEPDHESIQAIMEGYQQHYELSGQEIYGLLPAVQFLLAYQLGEYCKNNPSFQEDDLFLSKAQQRFNKAARIAEMAEAYTASTRL
jgi:thiamine kinase-like enzyme